MSVRAKFANIYLRGMLDRSIRGVIETTLLCENGRSAPRAGRECFDIFI